jgi:hypothetical protein
MRVAAAGFLVTVLLAALAAKPALARQVNAACGSQFRGLKTLSDPQRGLVNLHPKDTTLAAIAKLPKPQTTPTTRNTPFERQVWRVIAQIVEFRLDGDGAIQLTLFDDGVYAVAELPAPSCLRKTTRDRKAIVNARKLFVTSCGRPTTTPKPLGAVAKISGVGFWDQPSTRDTHAPNFAELYPVTALKIIAGCA